MYINFRTFDCLCFAYTLNNNSSKIKLRSKEIIFICYKLGIKGYVLLNIKSK